VIIEFCAGMKRTEAMESSNAQRSIRGEKKCTALLLLLYATCSSQQSSFLNHEVTRDCQTEMK
jgi:hypothetical protein